MFAPGVPQVLSDFKSTDALLGSFVVSIYVLGYAIGPIIIAPLSEMYGRLWIYHTTNVLFTIFTIACALSTSLGMLIGFRFLAGCAGSAVLTIGGGTISDLFKQEERGSATAIWSIGPLLGPVVGPVAGGFLSQAKGWRWVFWVITMGVGMSLSHFEPWLTTARLGFSLLYVSSRYAKATQSQSSMGRPGECERKPATQR